MDSERAGYLVERYADLLVRIGRTWLGDWDDAQDICQLVLIKLLEDPRQFPDQGQERAWVVRLAVKAPDGAGLLRSARLTLDVTYHKKQVSEGSKPVFCTKILRRRKKMLTKIGSMLC